MRVFITGVTGMLGYDCLRECAKRGFDAVGCGSRASGDSLSVRSAAAGEHTEKAFPYVQLDITEEQEVRRQVERVEPDVIIHCAAWTNVDAAEAPENRSRVFAVNAGGTENMAKAARAVNAKLICIGTDYVFGGEGEAPYKPDEESFAPLNIYGQSKLEGERAAKRILEKLFIVRSSWIFGVNGSNFIKTMIRAGKAHPCVRVVQDQIGTPTYSVDLAGLLLHMAETEKYGCYHAANEGGYVSRYDLCCAVYRLYGLNTKVIPVLTKEYRLSPAPRPLNSRLDTGKLAEAGFPLLPTWQDAVERYFREEHF